MNTRPLPPHGTWQRYANKRNGCHEPCCAPAWRAYQNDRNRRIAYGRHTVQPLVDAAPVREHLDYLRRAYGLNAPAVGALTGVALDSIRRIAKGYSRQVRADTADKILGAGFDVSRLDDRHLIQGTGTRRRLQALVAQGWTMRQIGYRLGWTSGENVRQILASDEGLVHVSTHRAIAAVFDELWDQQPPSATGSQRAAARAARNLAAARGWVGALAWDDETIDDPEAEPIDVTRPAVRSSVDVAEELADLLDLEPGITAERASARLGYRDAQSIYLALKRANRPDLRARLDRNNEAANPAPLVTKADAYGRRGTPTRKDTAA